MVATTPRGFDSCSSFGSFGAAPSRAVRRSNVGIVLPTKFHARLGSISHATNSSAANPSLSIARPPSVPPVPVPKASNRKVGIEHQPEIDNANPGLQVTRKAQSGGDSREGSMGVVRNSDGLSATAASRCDVKKLSTSPLIIPNA